MPARSSGLAQETQLLSILLPLTSPPPSNLPQNLSTPPASAFFLNVPLSTTGTTLAFPPPTGTGTGSTIFSRGLSAVSGLE